MSEAGGQPLGSAGAAALVRETRARGVQRVHKAIQFALAGPRQRWNVGCARIAASQSRFQVNELA